MSALDQHNGNSYVWKNHETDSTSPAIMESIDSISVYNRNENPSLNNSSLHSSLSLHGVNSLVDQNSKLSELCDSLQSFLLIDGNEYLKVFYILTFLNYSQTI